MAMYRNITKEMIMVKAQGQWVRIPAGGLIGLDDAVAAQYFSVLKKEEETVPTPKKEVLVDSPPDTEPLKVVEEKPKEEEKPVINTEPEKANYNELTKAEIKDKLDEADVEYDSDAKKAELVKLAEENL